MKIKDIIKEIEQKPVETKGHIYHPIPFPEFDHLTTSSSKDAVYEKWHIIKSWVDRIYKTRSKELRVLDVGSNAGFYTFSLAQDGASVKSFECHERYSYIGKEISKEKNLNVDWVAEAFHSKAIAHSDKFDIALLLSVFQWMANGDIKNQEALASLKLISDQSDYLFFELGFNCGKSCVRTSKLNHYAEMIQFLKRSTSYTNFKLIGKTRLWRGRKRYLILCSRNAKIEDSGYPSFLRKIKI